MEPETSDQDYIRIEVPRLPEFVVVLRRVLEVMAARARLPRADLTDIRQVLGEVCNQAVVAGGYAGSEDVLRLSCSLLAQELEGRQVPALHLLLDSPRTRFASEEECEPKPAARRPPAAPTGEAELLPLSLLAQMVDAFECYDTDQGTSVAITHFVKSQRAAPANG
jgi:hypothetical protein